MIFEKHNKKKKPERK